MVNKFSFIVRKFKSLVRKILAKLNVHFILSKYGNEQLEMYEDNTRPQKPKYINLGAGSFFHPLWHNVDMPQEFYSAFQDNIHIFYDFTSMKPLPFDDNSIEIAYCSHVVEHLPPDSINHLFKEVNRVMKKNGVFRISTPDADLFYDAYMNKDNYFWGPQSPWKTSPKNDSERFLEFASTLLSPTYKDISERVISETELQDLTRALSKEDLLNKLIEMLPSDANRRLAEGHCNWFNYNKIERLLRDSGFPKVYKSGYLQSSDPKLREPTKFDGTSPELSLYVECKA